MRIRCATLALPIVLIAIGCSEDPLFDAPAAAPAFAVGSGPPVRLLDVCEPITFNAELGAGSCTRSSGGVTFERFIAILTQTGNIGSWRITPTVLSLREGATVPVTNVGGEAHTYTEVEEFGGGIVPQLNALTGNTTVAPECTMLGGSDFLPAGQTVNHTFDEIGEEKYQCCIHPWMRQVVRVQG